MQIEWTSPKVNSIVCAFGNVSRMARALGHRHRTTVQKWVDTGSIPRWRIHEIEAAAMREGIKLPRWFRNGAP